MEVIRNLLIYINLLVFIVMIISCSTINKDEHVLDESEKILNQYLYISIDSITSQFDLKNKVIVYHDIYPDKVKHITLKGVINANDSEGNKRIDLLKELVRILDDTVRLTVNEKSFKTYSFYYKAESINENVNFDSPNFFGSINLSNVAFNKDTSLACYYIAIQCGSGCSSGYIVMFEKKGNEWFFVDINKIWGS